MSVWTLILISQSEIERNLERRAKEYFRKRVVQQ